MADKLLKSIKFPTLPDRYVIGDSTLTEEGAAAEAKAVGDALATKADTKGTYEDLIVGGAEQLMADGYETDKDPYLFRTTGGSADVGNREYLDSIVGGTVAWNQLMSVNSAISTYTKLGVTLTMASNEPKWTINGTYESTAGDKNYYVYSGTPISFLKNHVYMLATTSKYFKIYTYGVLSNALNFSVVVKASDNGNGSWCFNSNYIADGTAINETASVNVFDLTQMFGSTIADYIYSLEQATAGAGVAFFRNYFPKDYYPYDPGTLRSVEGVSAHETVGFNQWDEEWEQGYINTNTGQNGVSTAYVRSKNYIPVVPGANYYYTNLKTGISNYANIFYYDASKNFIGVLPSGVYAKTSTTNADYHNPFTIPANVRYIRFYSTQTYGTTYNHDICINISDPTRNGEYEPYTKHTYPLDSSLTLRGVPKLVDGKLAFDGDVYPPNGEVQRRYGVVDLGTLDWAAFPNQNNLFYVNLPTKKSGSQNCISKYPITIAATWEVMPDKSLVANPNNSYIYIKDSSYTDAASFKAAMSGVYLVYELATPTTETADGYEQYQICDPSGTEEFVTTGIVPVGHETRYPHDLKKKIETAPDSPSTDGTYLMKRSGGKNTYMALPSTPSANGAYVLTVTVSGGSASYSWAAKE